MYSVDIKDSSGKVERHTFNKKGERNAFIRGLGISDWKSYTFSESIREKCNGNCPFSIRCSDHG